ncbi:MAG: hypothetical protein WA006_10280, partial [Rhodoglobus sp.]
MKKNKFLAGVVALGLVASGLIGVALGVGSPAPAAATQTLVSYCHAATPSTAKNGWNAHLSQNVNSLNGHDGHPADIFGVVEGYLWSGQNLTTLYPAYGPGVTGAMILAGGCQDSVPGIATAELDFILETCDAPQQINLAGSTTSHASFGSDTDLSALGYNIVA